MKWTRGTTKEWVSGEFRIIKFFEYDHGDKLPRYAVTHRGARLLDWRDPVDLAHAKRQAEQYAQYLEVRHARRMADGRKDQGGQP